MSMSTPLHLFHLHMHPWTSVPMNTSKHTTLLTHSLVLRVRLLTGCRCVQLTPHPGLTHKYTHLLTCFFLYNSLSSLVAVTAKPIFDFLIWFLFFWSMLLFAHHSTLACFRILFLPDYLVSLLIYVFKLSSELHLHSVLGLPARDDDGSLKLM